MPQKIAEKTTLHTLYTPDAHSAPQQVYPRCPYKIVQVAPLSYKWRQSKNEDDLKNEYNLKNEDDIKNEDGLKNEDDLKNEDNQKMKPTPNIETSQKLRSSQKIPTRLR